jgi:hypothetical protein
VRIHPVIMCGVINTKESIWSNVVHIGEASRSAARLCALLRIQRREVRYL